MGETDELSSLSEDPELTDGDLSDEDIDSNPAPLTTPLKVSQYRISSTVMFVQRHIQGETKIKQQSTPICLGICQY